MHAVGDYVLWIDTTGLRHPARIDQASDHGYYVIRLERTGEVLTVHGREFSRA